MKFFGMRVKKVKALGTKVFRYRWAIKMFVLSLCLSSVFSLLSQTLMTSLGITMSVITIMVFIIISIVFDMIGIASTSAKLEYFESGEMKDKRGVEVAKNMVKNSEKVCSFCADVVGDICSILSGAGGACVIMSVANNIKLASIVILISTLVSSLIAGITIFGKACMKEYAIKNSEKILLRIGSILEKTIFRKRKKKM